MPFQAFEYRDMHYYYGMSGGNAALAARLYAENYPNRAHPDRRVIIALHQRMGEQNCLVPPRGGGPHVDPRRVEIEEEVLEEIANDPTTSTRQIARHIGASHMTVHRILKREGFHPFKYTPAQELRPGDAAVRMAFCQFLIERNRQDPLFLYNICWSDESTFTRTGIQNHHNSHVWAEENPHAIRENNFQYQWPRFNVWGAIIANEVHIRQVPDPLNGNNYLNFLEHNLPEIIGDGPGNRDIWFQQDGCPAHHDRRVTLMLNDLFPEQWIGRNGPVRWPPRSPDLTPLDFFLWGYLKEKIFHPNLQNAEEMVARLHAAVEVITPEMLGNVRNDLMERARLCLRENGGHFQHLL